jgi:glycosyltransferase involved in cell wall biosynthesis
MISIIICSRYSKISPELSSNIIKTIGCSFELIEINNSENQLSIFQAYNLGIQKSKGQFLCFMHEDIYFRSNNWGVKVIEHFSNEDIGMLGVIGGHFFPDTPATWWSTGHISGQYHYSQNHFSYFYPLIHQMLGTLQ